MSDSIDFLLTLQSAGTTATVSRLLTQAAGPLGFPVHVIAPVPTEQFPMNDGHFLLHNWPDRWSEHYDAEGFAAFDPVPRAVPLISRPMTLDDIYAGAAGFVPDPRAQRLRELGATFGNTHALVVPIFGPGGYRGIVCFAGPGPNPDAATTARLHCWAIYAHDRVRALSAGEANAGLVLSDRERAVLRCARDGLSDAEAAQVLGISVRTVRFHFDNLRRKLGTSTRAQAVATGIAMGLLES